MYNEGQFTKMYMRENVYVYGIQVWLIILKL